MYLIGHMDISSSTIDKYYNMSQQRQGLQGFGFYMCTKLHEITY